MCPPSHRLSWDVLAAQTGLKHNQPRRDERCRHMVWDGQGQRSAGKQRLAPASQLLEVGSSLGCPYSLKLPG